MSNRHNIRKKYSKKHYLQQIFFSSKNDLFSKLQLKVISLSMFKRIIMLTVIILTCIIKVPKKISLSHNS